MESEEIPGAAEARQERVKAGVLEGLRSNRRLTIGLLAVSVLMGIAISAILVLQVALFLIGSGPTVTAPPGGLMAGGGQTTKLLRVPEVAGLDGAGDHTSGPTLDPPRHSSSTATTTTTTTLKSTLQAPREDLQQPLRELLKD